MIKLNSDTEKLLRKLIESSRKNANHLLDSCDDKMDLLHCKDAAITLILIEQLEKAIGLIEDRPDTNNTLTNLKLFK